MVVASNRSPRPPLQILHENHVPPAIPTTMPWPLTRCPHVIQKPCPPLILLPSSIPNTTTQPTTWLPWTILPPNPPLHPPPHVIPSPRPSTCPIKSPPTALPLTLLFVPPIEMSHVAHDLRPSTNKQACPTAPTTPPRYNIIDPNYHDHPTTLSSTPPWRSTHITYPCMPGNISIQAMYHVMTLKAIKVAANSQWTGPIIDIEEHCFRVVHPVTKQTITQYKKLQYDPDLKHLWVPAMSKEIHPLTQGKAGITTATNTIFFLSHKDFCHMPTN
jgi:hypothetical protein